MESLSDDRRNLFSPPLLVILSDLLSAIGEWYGVGFKLVLKFVNLLEMLVAASDFLCLFAPSLKIFCCDARFFFFDVLDRIFKTFLLQFIHR